MENRGNSFDSFFCCCCTGRLHYSVNSSLPPFSFLLSLCHFKIQFFLFPRFRFFVVSQVGDKDVVVVRKKRPQVFIKSRRTHKDLRPASMMDWLTASITLQSIIYPISLFFFSPFYADLISAKKCPSLI